MERTDIVVVGAGVVGLAIARALAIAGYSVIILESAGGIGSGVSSRNSEVIHAGIYYPADSLKARLCIEGRRLLYAYCKERGIAHRQCGKLIVATTTSDAEALEKIAALAHANGVHSLHHIDAKGALAMEPSLRCVSALHSPESGIVDSHALMLALLGDAENHGAILVKYCRFVGAHKNQDQHWVITANDAEPYQFSSRWIINATGLSAHRVAQSIEGMPQNCIPPRWFAKGNYFSLVGASPFSRLIYPTPQDGGLGVHLTLDLGGQARFGPDVEWLAETGPHDAFDYAVNVKRLPHFIDSIRQYWPNVIQRELQPAYAGIRPKISGSGEPAADFMIMDAGQHGLPGIINLFGIESPGLTASLAIAKYVTNLVITNEATGNV